VSCAPEHARLQSAFPALIAPRKDCSSILKFYPS
jgi:hypothetical protein